MNILTVLKRTIAPLISLFILIMANGLFTTLLILRLQIEGSSPVVIGSMTAALFAGSVIALFHIEKPIMRIGHIRAFAAFASIQAAIYLLHAIFVIPWFWIFLRFLSGICIAGSYIVIESWLLILSTRRTRGQVLALYMIAHYGSLALGQLLINLSTPKAFVLFAIGSMLSSLSIVPLAFSKVGAPQFSEPSTLNFKKLYQISASGMVGSFCSGLTLSVIYGLLPLYIAEQTKNISMVATYMAITILGGMFLQYPIGRISDYIPRRKVLVIISAMTIVLSFLIIHTITQLWLGMIILFLFGGMAFTVYPISISYASDSLDIKDMVAGSQALLLAFSIGATFGPFIAPFFMSLIGTNGLFVYFIAISVIQILIVSWRSTQVTAAEQEEKFISIPQTTPLTAELDPRAEKL